MKSYRPWEPDQSFLFPPSPRDWLPEGHLVFFLLDLVAGLDLSEIEGAIHAKDARGNRPHDPRMMTALVLYGYCVGVTSSRRLERATHEDVGFRVLSGDQHPDHTAISTFRKRHLSALSDLFVQVLRLCQEAQLVKLGHVALDGTKVQANASKHKAMSHARMMKSEQELIVEVEAMLRRADECDAAEDELYGKDKRGDELPDELCRRESRLKKLAEARQALEAQAAKRHAEKKRAQAQRAQKKAEEHQIIIAAGASNQAPDVEYLKPMLEQAVANCGATPAVFTADAGYWSDDNARFCEELGTDAYIATGRQKHGTPGPDDQGSKKGNESELRIQMRDKLRTEDGKAKYTRRKAVAEPPFGQIKEARGIRRFLLRGMDQARQEWSLICAGHNILKLFRAQNT